MWALRPGMGVGELGGGPYSNCGRLEPAGKGHCAQEGIGWNLRDYPDPIRSWSVRGHVARGTLTRRGGSEREVKGRQWD
jgi:hypothetical protein